MNHDPIYQQRRQLWADAVRAQPRLSSSLLRSKERLSVYGVACDISDMGKWVRCTEGNNPLEYEYELSATSASSAEGGWHHSSIPAEVKDWLGLDCPGRDEHWLSMLGSKSRGWWDADGRIYTPGELADEIERANREGV